MGSWTDWQARARHWMKTHRIRQADVAAEMRVSRSTVGHWLSGHNAINLTDFFTLCAVIGADPGFLLFGQPQFIAEIQSGSYAQKALRSPVGEQERYMAWQKRMRKFKSRARRAKMR